MPAIESKSATATERLERATAAGRVGDKAAERKMYRLSVVPDQRKEVADVPVALRQAPFFSHSVTCNAAGGSATFNESTFRHVENQRGQWTKQERPGNYQRLTDAEAETVRAKMGDWLVRWHSRWAMSEGGGVVGGRAVLLDATKMPVAVDPTTDQAASDFLKIELVSEE